MISFHDISNPDKTSDYLSILLGALLTDVLLMLYFNITQFNGALSLKRWYDDFGIFAVLADVGIIFIVVVIARFLYRYIAKSFSIWKFTGLVVAIQVIHDIFFYQVCIMMPRGVNRMIDLFNDYGNEVGVRAIIADIIMVIMTSLFASLFAGESLNTNILLLLGTTYVLPYAMTSYS